MTGRAASLFTCATAAAALLLGVACDGGTRPPPRTPRPVVPAPDSKRLPAKIAPSDVTETSGSSFRIEKKALRVGGVGPRDLAHLGTSAFRYFRMLARPFEVRTCQSFRDLRWSMPVAAVHGDAHIEQFVVTNDTYGVEDFDQSGAGPAVVDLVRYAASIALAAREVGFPCNANQAIEKFFTAYRAAIDHPPPAVPAPAVVARLRKRAPQTRALWLDWVEQQMLPLSHLDEGQARKSWTTFVDLQRAVRPDRSADFFDVVNVGELRMGVGSALERKLLARVRGPTADPNDDVVLELRAGGDTTASGCVWRPDRGDSLHVLRFMAMLGPRMPEVFGYVGLSNGAPARPFWVQSWSPGYVELSLEDLESQSDLDEIAENAATQLAGHFWTHEQEVLRNYQRFSQLHGFDLVRERAIKLAAELALEVIKEWERFRAEP